VGTSYSGDNIHFTCFTTEYTDLPAIARRSGEAGGVHREIQKLNLSADYADFRRLKLSKKLIKTLSADYADFRRLKLDIKTDKNDIHRFSQITLG
jgi:hypothetical protein